MLKNDIKHLLRQKQMGFFCKHKKAALSMIKRFHVFLMTNESSKLKYLMNLVFSGLAGQ